MGNLSPSKYRLLKVPVLISSILLMVSLVGTPKVCAQHIPLKDTLEGQSVPKDSLEKLLPYLNEVKGDNEQEVSTMYVLAIAVSSLISEDLAAIGAGLLAVNGIIPFWYAALGAIIGILFGDYSLYFAGRYLGKPILRKAPIRWFIKEESIERSEVWFEKKGPFILFLSRFIPGSRLPVYLTAGILGTGFWKFSLYFGLTVLIWTPMFVWLSMLAGQEILYLYETYDQYAIPAILLIIILFIGFYKILPLLFTYAGRRLLWKKIRSYFSKNN